MCYLTGTISVIYHHFGPIYCSCILAYFLAEFGILSFNALKVDYAVPLKSISALIK